SLGQALSTLKAGWLLHTLDQSWRAYHARRKTLADHQQYFEQQLTAIKRLSLRYHPDKHLVDQPETQRLILQTMDALKQVHALVRSKHSHLIGYQLYAGLGLQETPLDLAVIGDQWRWH